MARVKKELETQSVSFQFFNLPRPQLPSGGLITIDLPPATGHFLRRGFFPAQPDLWKNKKISFNQT